MSIVRVWDAPTRLFHWALVLLMVAMVITGEIGGQAMVWHFRFGYAILTLVLFRIIWGLIGGYWSRFYTFVRSPLHIWRYLRGKGGDAHVLGHNPLGAVSVLAMLLILVIQALSGMMSDDEIAFAGPLTALVSSATVQAATFYHKEIGKAILIVLVVLHIGAIVFYRVKKSVNLVTPMLTGDKEVNTADAPASKDNLKTRLIAVVTLICCALLVRFIVNLGGAP
jgi:cytochrome b